MNRQTKLGNTRIYEHTDEAGLIDEHIDEAGLIDEHTDEAGLLNEHTDHATSALMNTQTTQQAHL